MQTSVSSESKVSKKKNRSKDYWLKAKQAQIRNENEYLKRVRGTNQF